MTLVYITIAFIAGYIVRSWMLSRKTGRPLRVTIMGGGPNEPEGPV